MVAKRGEASGSSALYKASRAIPDAFAMSLIPRARNQIGGDIFRFFELLNKVKFNRDFPLGFEMMTDEFARQFWAILFCHSELWQNKITRK